MSVWWKLKYARRICNINIRWTSQTALSVTSCTEFWRQLNSRFHKFHLRFLAIFDYFFCRNWKDKHTCPLYIAFCSGLGHRHTKGADGSHYQVIYEPTEPFQPMMSDNVSDEDRPQHRELRPLLLPWHIIVSGFHCTWKYIPNKIDISYSILNNCIFITLSLNHV